MRWLTGLAIPVALVLNTTQASAAPRVASAGLCADQMVLMLADRGQIASVSEQASGPLSVYANRAEGLPINRGAAEEIIASRTQVYLYSDKMDQRTAAALKGFGVKTIQVPFANTWDEVDAMTRLIADAIGQKARGEAILAHMHQRLERARVSEPRTQWPTIVYYRPDGGGAGAGTFVAASLSAAGFRNVQEEWGPPLWSGVPIERLVRQPPDAYAVSYFDTSRNAASVLRRNPVLWGHARTRPVINVPGKYWNCGSPLLIHAVEQLSVERSRFQRARNGK